MSSVMDPSEEVKFIHEEFKIWKKNTPFLYDLVISQALEWPSLTVQWLPGYETLSDKDSTLHTLLLGTHTSNETPNSLVLANVLLPDPNSSEINMEQFTDDSIPLSNLARPSNRIRPFKYIAHDGEVNRARCNPFNKDIVVTKTIKGNVFLFNTAKQNDRSVQENCDPDLKLLGHSEEGYGLSWNSFADGLVLSGSEDCKICIWNIHGVPSQQKVLNPMHSLEDHTKAVMDVSWNPDHGSIFGSVSDDQFLNLYDIRQPTTLTSKMHAHNSEINCLSFNPVNANLVATGSSDKTIALIDTRYMTTPLHIFDGHCAPVYMVSWNPSRDSLLGSCGADRRAMVWDVARIGLPQTEEEKEDGPPELMFVHGGHTAPVSDFSWNSNVDHGVLAATNAEDNIIQVWQVSESCYEEKNVI